MLTRYDVLGRAADECMKELYSYVQPSIEWDEFKKECKIYSEKYRKNRELKDPRPFEFYYIPEEILKEIINSYIYAYKIDNHKELLDTITILKNYCNDPIIENNDNYNHVNNLTEEIINIIKKSYPDINEIELSNDCVSKFFEFLDMAGNFFKWNSDLSLFTNTIYLGCSPSCNKDSVIENWKIYRKQNIEINEEEIKRNYYGDDE